MNKKLSVDIVERIIQLRRKGSSLPEIHKELKIPKTTIYRYIDNVKILPEFYKLWRGKRGGSSKRKEEAKKRAEIKAKRTIISVSDKEKVIFLTALYWGEGSKLDFGLSNTDPRLIRVFIQGLRNIFRIPEKDITLSIRVYEDLNIEKCLKYWAKITQIPKENFISVNILKGRKKGKLDYGMCRVRVRKGGNLLKYMAALKEEIITYF